MNKETSTEITPIAALMNDDKHLIFGGAICEQGRDFLLIEYEQFGGSISNPILATLVAAKIEESGYRRSNDVARDKCLLFDPPESLKLGLALFHT
jgi:hypothetical protein